MRVFHLIRALGRNAGLASAALLTIVSPAQGQSAAPVSFSILLRGTAVGSEQVTVERNPQGTTISSTGRMGPPFDLVLRGLQIRYDGDGKPLAMTVDATAGGRATTIQTTVSDRAATYSLTPVNGPAVTGTEAIEPAAVLLPNPFVAPYEALAMRLRTASAGSTVPIYQPSGPTIIAQVGDSTPQQIQTLNGMIHARQTRIALTAAGLTPTPMVIWGDDAGRLLRVSIPSQSLELVREDLASVATRIVTMSRPNDEDVRIPANGFTLAGTLSKPMARAAALLPVVLLLSGTDQTDRDETIGGVPIFGQLADALADSGVMVLRYDKRGIGQSGGRADVATLADYADDAKSAVLFLRERKDVDRRHILVVGHGEGGWIAMLTAADNDRVAGVALLSTVAVSGADLNLYQLAHGMERGGRTESDRQSALTLQQQIQQAVVSGRGWESIKVSPQTRRQADTPYFQSFLTLDPAKLVRRINQPILVLQGALDKELPSENAAKLEALAKARKSDRVVDVIQLPGLNHLLVAATTGEVDEYGALKERTIGAGATTGLTQWVQKTIGRK